jgi:hypothetical protein
VWWIVSEKFDIKEWQDLEDKGWNSLLLGNGASIAVSGKFSYGTLYEVAKKYKSFRGAEKIFDGLDTKDFERVLLACWYAQVVNNSLGLEQSSKKTLGVYECVRDALIRSVKKVHPSHDEILTALERISLFMSKFGVVFSLNYDLIVYWAAMLRNRKNGYRFKDCFLGGGLFCGDVDDVRRRFAPEKGTRDTLIFYPHGNLVISDDFSYNERKVVVDGGGDLLTTIGKEWKENNLKPVFVSEGTSSEKLASIGRSRYLTIVYERLIPTKVGEGLVVYGWWMQDNDRHILDAIKLGSMNRMAVSVFRSKDPFSYCRHVMDSLEKAGIDVKPEFFWSDSPGCWNNPKKDVKKG